MSPRFRLKMTAFTLLELIIVIIVMGVLLALAVPRFINAYYIAESVEAFSQMSAIRKAIQSCFESVNYTNISGQCDTFEELNLSRPGEDARFRYSIAFGEQHFSITAATLDFGLELGSGCDGKNVKGGKIMLDVPYFSGDISRCGAGIFRSIGNEDHCLSFWGGAMGYPM